jgi:hypothetical protein
MTGKTDTRNSPLYSDALDSRLGTLTVFAMSLAFYLYTLQPSLSWGDGTRLQREAITGESFILAELVDVPFAPDPFPFARLGVAAWDHPLYVIIGHALVELLPGVSSLWLVNLISALFGAGAVALLFWLCYTHTRSLVASLYAALALAVSHTFWFHSSTPEVYTLFAVLLLLSLSLYTRFERTGSYPALAESLFVLGLGGSNHLLAFLAVPAAVLYHFISGGFKPQHWRRPNLRWILLCGLAFVAGFAPYLIQLARMLRTFPLTQVSGPVVGSTFLQGLLGTPLPELLSSLPMYLIFLIYQFGPVGLAAGVYGFWKGKASSPELWRTMIAFYAVYALFGMAYHVSDQFAFFLGSHLFWAMAMGFGVAHFARGRQPTGQRWLAVALALAVVVMPPFYGAMPRLARSVGVTDDSFGIPQIGVGVRDGLEYYLNPNNHGDDGAYRFGTETLDSLPHGAVVITQWYTDTDEYFILRYLATVEGMRPDVEIVGWPHEELIEFDSAIALAKIESDLRRGRPVYLASLSERYYQASTLVERYCIVPEGSLYRIHQVPPESPDITAPICATTVQP